MNARYEPVVGEFPNLSACVKYARTLSSSEGYLFRGESSDRYCTTLSTHDRVVSDLRLPPKCRHAIEERVQWLHRDLQLFLGLPPDLAMGFLQHYEAPTKMLDLTTSPEVAASFAAGRGGDEAHGLFAVVPRSAVVSESLIDLSQHPKANRPRRQRALAFQSQKCPNLKEVNCVRDLGIRWYRFAHSPDETKKWTKYAKEKELLDAHTDEVAGVLQLLLHSYEKTNDCAADWLANHVVAAPFVTKIVEVAVDGGLVIELVAPGPDFDLAIERVNNRRIWSNAYPYDSPGQGGFRNDLRAIQLLPDPAAPGSGSDA
ncbi:FRG domain-containing protein [Paraburkholderia sp. GAS448]|uniref:FRG domain-containing protein n=1 Tax=Paraburkholderia sp. GAS448 TaxID=3035136 RepID=UPI003D1FD913